MTPQERELIQDLFDRMRDFGPPTKDREADQLISQSVSELRDAPSMLVQSTLVQEHALEQASARIQELEDRLHMLHERQRPLPSGSFLGRLFGGGGATIPQGSPRAREAQPSGASAGIQQAPSGGFLQSAMSTAAGIGGGLLVSNALRNVIDGHAQAGQDTLAHEALARQDAADDAEIDQQVQDELDDAETDAGMDRGGDEMDV